MSLVEERPVTEMGECTPVSAPILEGGSAPLCPDCGHPMLPAGLESDEGSDLRFRCFVRKGGERGYIAECVDLDLAAESDTWDGAVSGLHDAIVGYLMVVLDGVETEQAVPQTILRPSPLSHRIRYHVGYWRNRLIRLLSGGRRNPNSEFYSSPYGLGNQQCHV
jgi:hypothetical protein